MARYRLAVNATYNGEQNVNVFHFQSTAGAPSPADLAGAWVLDLNAEYLACHPLKYTQVSVKVTDIDTLAVYELPVTSTGTRVGDVTAPQSSAVVSWKTGLATRRGQGRTYIGPISEADASDGIIGGSLLAALGPWRDEMVNGVETEVASYKFGVYSVLDDVLRLVNAGLVRTIVYNMGRRTVGRGS